MVSQHRFAARYYRPDDTEYEPAKRLAEADGFNMNVLIRAFLRHLNAEPRAVMAVLKPHMEAVEAEKPKGRPGPRRKA